MKKGTNFVSKSLRIAKVAAGVTVSSVVAHRFQLIDFQPALLGLATGVLLGFTAVIVGLIGTVKAVREKQPDIMTTLAGSTLGFLVMMPVVATVIAGAGAPPIHDITTDLDNPPEFLAIKASRMEAHNSLDRSQAKDLMRLQKSAYPDLQPLIVNRPFDQVFEQAAVLVKKRGWVLAGMSVASGRIEATDTTPMMGFKDDVVIRIQPAGEGTRVDMRSVSRVGRGDLGTNAARIRAFLADLGRSS